MEPARDTSHEAQAIQRQILRRMPPAQRLAIAAELTEDVLRIGRAGAAFRSSRSSDADRRQALGRSSEQDR